MYVIRGSGRCLWAPVTTVGCTTLLDEDVRGELLLRFLNQLLTALSPHGCIKILPAPLVKLIFRMPDSENPAINQDFAD